MNWWKKKMAGRQTPLEPNPSTALPPAFRESGSPVSKVEEKAENLLKKAISLWRNGHGAKAIHCLRPLAKEAHSSTGRQACLLLSEIFLDSGEEDLARDFAEIVLTEQIESPGAWAVLQKTRRAPMLTVEEEALPGDRFTLLRLLGQGGGGHVYLANDRLHGAPVALKRLHFSEDGKSLKTRLRGSLLVSSIPSHPCLLPILDVDPALGITTHPYIQGSDLRSLLGSPLSLARWRKNMLALVRGLSHLHHHGILHLDIKPSNVLLSNSGDIFLTDYSLACDAPPWPALGTPDYAAPEMLLGLTPSPASDIYSLGIIAYELAAGRRPFPAGTPVRPSAFPPMKDDFERFPAEYCSLTHESLKLDPAARPTCADWLRILQKRVSRGQLPSGEAQEQSS